jgi:hypothetical protein
MAFRIAFEVCWSLRLLVTILGCFDLPPLCCSRLTKLVELINEHGPDSVSALVARYAGTVGHGPWVASIKIARLDKFGGIPD